MISRGTIIRLVVVCVCVGIYVLIKDSRAMGPWREVIIAVVALVALLSLVFGLAYCTG